MAALQSGGMHVKISKTGGWGPFTMRTDQKPFDDARVRQAFRLIVDRQEMLNQVFGGHGKVGNDVFGILDKSHPDGSAPARAGHRPGQVAAQGRRRGRT